MTRNNKLEIFNKFVLYEMGPARTSQAWYFHNPDYVSIGENYNFLFIKTQHVLWILKRTTLMSRFFLAPKTHVKTIG